MAGVELYAKTAAITLISTETHTLLQLVAAASHRVLVRQISVSFNGVTAADAPLLIEVLRQTTAGTMSSLTPVKVNSGDDETLQTTAQHTATAEPTSGDLLWGDYVHMQTGIILIPRKPFVIIGGGKLGIRYVAGTITGTVKAVVTALCEE